MLVQMECIEFLCSCVCLSLGHVAAATWGINYSTRGGGEGKGERRGGEERKGEERGKKGGEGKEGEEMEGNLNIVISGG